MAFDRGGGERGPRRRAGCRGAALLAVGVATALLGSHRPGHLGFAQTGAGRETTGSAGRRHALAALVGGLAVVAAEPRAAWADGASQGIILPPIDKARQSCKFKSSEMGQANAAGRDFDLRGCTMPGRKADGMDIAGVLMDDGDFSNTTFKETAMSKAIARKANFNNVDFTRAIADRINFQGSSFREAIFSSTLLTGSDFKDADLTNSDFTDSIIDQFGIRPLCANPTMKGTNSITGADTFESAGCNARYSER